ncbi:MAG: ATP-binding protein [Deltaproteobacteria bacterium]|nr:ATP-binding protein [Deltaproteobacteria bacterium]
MLKDLKKKMVIITGPRQVGKTYLSKEIMKEFPSAQYLNHDNEDDRRIIRRRSWRLNAGLLAFDEIHKMKNWKGFLKGTFDSRPEGQAILVTGSSRLETYRQTGESLAGRYLHLRLLPLSVKELSQELTPFDAVEKLNRFGGFPEPFLSASEEDASRWRNQYYTDLLREDIVEFSRIQEIKAMRGLVELLRHRVGSSISYMSLAEDLQISPNTVKRYISILESLYIIFLIRPFHKNIARSILREPKVYFYDSAFVKGDEGVRLENTCALCLLKHVHYLYDVRGRDTELNYIRTKDGKEVDFVIVADGSLHVLIEVKLSDKTPARSLIHFAGQLTESQNIQLVHHLHQEEHRAGVDILRAGDWLAGLEA